MSEMTFAQKLDYKHRIEPADVVAYLQEPKIRRRDVARAYGLLLLENWNDLGTVRVAALNAAIIDQWSMAGLLWIKREAWKIATLRAPAPTGDPTP